MAQIFLSYAREDEEKVEDLYQKLSDAGFKPWMAQKDIFPGEQWELCIPQAIRHSDFFLACLSANSVDKRGFIQKEIREALDIWREKLDSDIYLIPVRLEKCEVPESLRKFHWVNLFEEDGWTRLVEAIQEGMKRRAEVTADGEPPLATEMATPKEGSERVLERSWQAGGVAMSSYHPQEIEERVGVWLDRVGWERNPFARPDSLTTAVRRAEDERETLGRYFLGSVIRIGMPWTQEKERPSIDLFEDLVDEKHHGVLFASYGEGKSACRLMVADVGRNRDILVAEYVNFDERPRSAKEHAHEIVYHISLALQERQSMVKDTIAPGMPEPLKHLADLTHVAKDQGLRAIFVLVDRVSDFGPQPTESEVEQIVEGLFIPSFFEVPGLRFKFFLPDYLAKRLANYQVISRMGYPVFLFHVDWTKQALRQLLGEKILSVSRRGEDSFSSLSIGEKGQTLAIDESLNVDDELIDHAWKHRPGAPRNLNLLANNLIYTHARSAEDPERLRITKRDLEEAIMRSSFPKEPIPLEEKERSRRRSTEDGLSLFWLLALLVAVISAGGLVTLVYRATSNTALAVVASIFASLFLILIGALALMKGRFKPEQTLDILRGVLDILGGALSSLIGSVADVLRGGGKPKNDGSWQ